jgi:hypothetical protein
MKKVSIIVQALLIFLCLTLFLTACQSATATPAPKVNWQIKVAKTSVKDTLHSIETVTQYNGSELKVDHTQSPASGNVYVIIDATVSKVGNQTDPFDWKNLTLQDAAGNNYARMDNDSFLEVYKYSPRITGLLLRVGENSGWMAFEVPAQAASGKLYLVYSGAGSKQKIELNK